MTPISEATAVQVAYRNHEVLNNLSLAIGQGSITGVFGPNGVGKTTVLKTLAGHLIPTTGTVRVQGEDPVTNAAAAQSICLVGTGSEAPLGWPAQRTLQLHAAARRGWDQGMADRLVTTVGLDTKKAPTSLSLGQRSALAMIIGLASRAPITLFDEVTVGMDAHTRQLFAAEIARENAELGRTFVLSTHLITDVEHLVSDAVVMAQRGVVFTGSTEELRGTVCAVTGQANQIAAVVEHLPPTSAPVVLSSTSLGSTTRAILRCRAAEVPSALGLTVESVSLEDAVVALTTPPQDTA